jgi:eukaryotic-like serine/threonine-protein kinase
MVILGAFSLLFLSILWEGEPQQQPQLQQLQLPPLANVLPAEATTMTTNNTTDTGNGNNLTIQEQLSTNDTTAASSAGLRIAYPKGWIANDLGNGTVRFSTPLRTDLMRFTVNVVNIPPSLQQNLTLDRLVDINLNSLKQQLSNFTLFESNQTTISATQNQTAQKIVYTNTNKNPNFPLGFKTMQIFAVKDGQAYTISYVSEESQYLKYLPVIERMIDSISFTNQR